MRNLNLTKQLFLIISAFILFAVVFMTFHLYYQTSSLIEKRAISRSKSLQTYFMSMRYIYHNQFLNSGLELNDSTVGFLPAHAASFISDEFSKRTQDGISIRNVSDRPRNPTNMADSDELRAMKAFEQNPELKERFTNIRQNNQDYFFYAAPIKIEPYCIQCHGKKEEVLPYIAGRYETAYNYKVGDIRGITSIKIPKQLIAKETLSIFWTETILNLAIIALLLGMIYYVIRLFTRRDIEYKHLLEEEVRNRTADLEETAKKLEESNRYQQHLFSILRTVADSNKILITTQSLEELIEKTAQCLEENPSFSIVRISLLENEHLNLKVLFGLEVDWDILPIEKSVLNTNQPSIISDFSSTVSETCRVNVERFQITGMYVSPLRKDYYASEAFGVMMICTTQPGGFTDEEGAMIDELSGDLGFAINSFYQREDIVKLSYFDPLTDLPNRRLFIERLTHAMLTSARTLQYAGLLFIDLDHFKGVNDLKGHYAGDSVLKMMAQRLLSVLRQNDIIARFGGDEFVVLIENLGKTQHEAALSVQATVTKILEVSKEPFIIDDQLFYLSASVGIVLFYDDEYTMDQLFTYADSAMYAAKNSGRNTARFYDSALQETMSAQVKLIQDLCISMSNNDFYLVYQEQVNNEGDTVGVEALIRWQHPNKGIISPLEFIPIAETSGLIIPLGGWIMHQAIWQLVNWKNDPIKQHWRISVNVSPKQFEEEDFVPKLQRLMEEIPFTASQLRLELTEGLLIQNAQKAMDKINILKSLGYTLSIDDFGTGYSSLSYLKNLPIDELKIDQSFIKALSTSDSDKTIVQTVITMGHTFGLEVIAEGVETAEQCEILKAMGCDIYQGYLFSRPQKAEYYNVV
ncbi:MAG: EAL domain-containing protein [Pseudomonadota bacterium]